jgi:DNA-binding beta-propeller fold protein YncE
MRYLRIMQRRTIPVALLSVAASALLAAEPTPRESLLILSKTDQTLSILNPTTLTVVARMPSGPDPHEVVASTDGKMAFISNYGGGAYNTLTPVDLVAQKSLPAVDLGPLRGPHGLMFVGGKVWFTAEAAKVVGSYDPATKKVDWVLGTGQNRTHMIYVFPDLKRMITSNITSATMTIIDKTASAPRPGGAPPREDWDEAVIAVGRGAEGFDVTPNGKELWSANAQDGTISILDLTAKKVTQTLDANVQSANRLKFTPDGKMAFISALRLPDAVVFDVAGRKEVKRIKIGRGAAGIQISRTVHGRLWRARLTTMWW